MNIGFSGTESMIYIGKVANGVVVLPPDLRLPEGTEVQIAPLGSAANQGRLREVAALEAIAQSLDNLPDDLAQQHDHYIYGTPKQ